MIVKFRDLPALRDKLRKKKIVFAIGVFDLFHRGHVEYLKKLRGFGDCVIVGVCSDKAVSKLRGPLRPIREEKERLILVDSIRYVDYVFLVCPSRRSIGLSRMVLEKLRPNVFVVFNKKRWLAHRSVIESYGVKLKVISDRKINSTTRIIAKIVKLYALSIFPNR